MKIRLISAAVALLIFIPVVIVSDSIVLPIAVALVSVIGLFEIFRCVGVHKNIFFGLPYYLVALIVPAAIHCVVADLYPLPIQSIFLIALLALVVWSYPCAIFSKGSIKITDACTASIGAIYLTAGLNSLLFVRQGMDAGFYHFALIFIGAWITDSAAYFCGRAFGKHKLIPDVSPKKTVEGSVGGTLICVLCFVIFALIVQALPSDASTSISVNYPALIVCGLVISIVSQIGDLAMSLMKRHYGIKDFGKIMPGHGGVLDRFDSILAAAIVLLICCSVLTLFDFKMMFEIVRL